MQKQALTGTNAYFGDELISSGVTGLGIGAGATALYYVLDKMRRAKQRKRLAPEGLVSLSAGGPTISENALLEHKQASSTGTNAALGGLLGALGGGAYGALTAEPRKKNESALFAKLRGGLRGALGAGAVGAGVGAAYRPMAEGLGSLISKDLIPSLGGNTEEIVRSPTSAHRAWRTLANLGFLGGGVLGGRAIVNHFAKDEKDQENADTVAAARQEYFDALSGRDKSSAAILDAKFDEFEKNGWALWRSDAESDVLAPIYTGMLLAAAGGAGLGGTYMYNRTKKLSDAENLRRALESRARTRGTPAMLVDPEELAAAKLLASGEKAPAKRRRSSSLAGG